MNLIYQGKTKSVYEADSQTVLLVATDKVATFEGILLSDIPGKGEVLIDISSFWFRHFNRMLNHLIDYDLLKLKKFGIEKLNQAHVCRKTNVLPIEFVVHGYIAGTLWEEYQEVWKQDNVNKNYSDEFIASPNMYGMLMGQRMYEYEEIEYYDGPTTCSPLVTKPICIPVIKGSDERITFEHGVEMCASHYNLPRDAAEQLMKGLIRRSIDIYSQARNHAVTCGFVIANTKIEFGMAGGQMMIVDELLTPDSSTYWELNRYDVGKEQYEYDKHILREYIIEHGFGYGITPVVDGNAKPPKLTKEVERKTLERYQLIRDRLIAV